MDFSESVIFDPKSTFPILKTIFSLIKVGKLLQTYSQSIFLPLGRFWDAYSGIWDRKNAFLNLRLKRGFPIPNSTPQSARMRKIISPIDPESIFTQDIGLHFFNEAPRSAEIELSELGPYSHSSGFAL